MDQNQTVGASCVKLRCEFYKKFAHSHQNIWEDCGKIPAALYTLDSAFTIHYPDCILISLLPCLLKELLLFTAQLKYFLFQDDFYDSYHPPPRQKEAPPLWDPWAHVPVISAPPVTNWAHKSMGVKSVPTSGGCCER